MKEMDIIRKILVALMLILWVAMGYENYRNMSKVSHFENRKGPQLILFWANWCGHCSRIKGKGGEKKEWDILEEKKILTSKGLVDVVNYEESETPPELLKKFEIVQYPTIVFVKEDGSHIIQEEGERRVENWEKFVRENII